MLSIPELAESLSILTIAWSMCAAASFMLALLHLLLWFKDRKAYVYLLSVLMAANSVRP